MNQCIEDTCEQGDGSEAETLAWAKCQAKCIEDHYYKATEGTPRATGAAGSGAASGAASGSEDASNTSSATAPRATNSNGVETGSTKTDSEGKPTGTDAAAEETDDPSAAAPLKASFAAVAGLFLAALAL